MEQPQRRVVHISWSTFARTLTCIALVWLWLRIWQWVLVFVVGAFLAVALDPVADWLARRGIKRSFGAPLLVGVIAVIIVLFIYLSGASLMQEGRVLTGRLDEIRNDIERRIPPDILRLLPRSAASNNEQLGSFALRLGQSLVSGMLSLGVALILTVYLLLDGRRTYEWLAAFARKSRPRLDRTAAQARKVIIAYVRANFVTSLLAFACAWIVLALLGVPAALLLAIMTGVFDLLPVIGFFLSAIPAVVLGFTVSPVVGFSVAAFYIAYQAVENYYITPKVYGHELQMSDLAVIAAFAVGAELGGVIGALIALPIAALWPVIEQHWLADRIGQDVVSEQRRVEQTEPH